MAHTVFIAFDGPDGVGKSTLISHVCCALRARGVPIDSFHEWKGGPYEHTIRKLASSHVDPFALFTWVLASRCYTLEKRVMRALLSGKSALLDRYYASSLVYQRLDGIDVQLIERFILPFTRPHLHVQLRCPVELLCERLRSKSEIAMRDRIEELVNKYDEAFDLLRHRGECVVTLDTVLPPHVLTNQVTARILSEAGYGKEHYPQVLP